MRLNRISKSRNILLIVAILTITIGLVALWADKGPAEEEKQYRPNEIAVGFKPGVSLETIKAINQRVGTEFLYPHRLRPRPEGHGCILKIISDLSVPEAVQEYEKLPEVEYVSPNYGGELE